MKEKEKRKERMRLVEETKRGGNRRTVIEGFRRGESEEVAAVPLVAGVEAEGVKVYKKRISKSVKPNKRRENEK